MPVPEPLDLAILRAELSTFGGLDIKTEFALVCLVPFCCCSVVLWEEKRQREECLF
jgi:hypothetical protein